MGHTWIISQHRYVCLVCVLLDFETTYFDLAASSIAVHPAHHLNRFWLNFVSDDALLDQEFVFLDGVILHYDLIFIIRGLDFFISWRTTAIWWSWNLGGSCHRAVASSGCSLLRWIYLDILDGFGFEFAWWSLLVEREVICFIIAASLWWVIWWYLLYQLESFLIGAWYGRLPCLLRDFVVQVLAISGVAGLLALSWSVDQRLWADLPRCFALAQITVLCLLTQHRQ